MGMLGAGWRTMTTRAEAGTINRAILQQVMDAYGARLLRELGGAGEFLAHMLCRHVLSGRMELGEGQHCYFRLTIEFGREPMPARD